MNNQLHDSGQMEPFYWLSEILVTIAIIFITMLSIYLTRVSVTVVFLEDWITEERALHLA